MVKEEPDKTMIAKLFGIRLPLAIFVLSVLVFLSVGSLMIYSALISNLVDDGNWLHIKTDVCELNFPKHWYLARVGGREGNKTIYIIYLLGYLLSDDLVSVNLVFYNKAATQDFMKENNLTDVSTVPYFEAQQMYNRILSENENATLHFIEEKSELLGFITEWARNRGYNAYSLLVNIKNAYEVKDVYYNVTGLFISLMIDHQRLLEIIFYGEENSWEKNQGNFEKVLSSIKIISEIRDQI